MAGPRPEMEISVLIQKVPGNRNSPLDSASPRTKPCEEAGFQLCPLGSHPSTWSHLAQRKVFGGHIMRTSWSYQKQLWPEATQLGSLAWERSVRCVCVKLP